MKKEIRQETSRKITRGRYLSRHCQRLIVTYVLFTTWLNRCQSIHRLHVLLANTTLASSQRSISSGYQARYRASGRSSRENLRGTGVKSLRSLPEKELRSTGDYRTCVRSMERMEVRSFRGKECERDASTELLRKQARHEASGKKRNVTRSNWLQRRRNREEPARRELREIFAVENRFLEIVSRETLFVTAPGCR